MSSDTPLFCECGNRLGLRRLDGTYVSTHRGRTVTVPNVIVVTNVPKRPWVMCEKCSRVTEVDKLSVDKVR